MQLRTHAMLVALTSLPACQLPREPAPDAAHADVASLSDGPSVDAATCTPGMPDRCGSTGTSHVFRPNDCSTLSDSIFLLGSDAALLRYEPRTGRYLRDIPQNCMGGSAYSLAVGRDARAFYYDTFGRLRNVNMATGVCEPELTVTYGPDLDDRALGTLTYVGREGEPEHLFVMRYSTSGRLVLAELDPVTLTMNVRVPLDPRIPSRYDIIGSPTGEVWSFIRLNNVQRVIARIDLDTGMLAETYDVSSMGPPVQDESTGDWSNAVVLWGGRFFVWMQAPREASASLYRFTPPAIATDPGLIEVMQRDTGLRIVGAATSTCPPIL